MATDTGNIDRYEIEFVGGPQDGVIDYVLNIEETIKYYSAPGRITLYRKEKSEDSEIGWAKTLYYFEGYCKTPKIGGI